MIANPAKTVFKRLASARLVKKVMADHFLELDAAAKAGAPKIAWCSSVGPAELLRACGFLVYFPENHGALLGATRRATECIPKAHAAGYGSEVCSYLTSDIGAYIKGETPLSMLYQGIERVPRPDVLVYNTNQCRDVKEWFMWFSRELGVPCVGIESFKNVDKVDAELIRVVSARHKALVPLLEKISGTRFDIDRLREVVGLSKRCSELWNAVLETAKGRPAPFTFFDGLVHMGPAVVARGTESAIAYYEELLKELGERVRNRVGAVDDERHRIYWDGMPVWGKVRDLGNLFIRLRTAVVASNYCNAWVFPALDPADPFESMARAYSELFIARSDQAKEAIVRDTIAAYGIDGVLFHDAKTCPNTSNGRYGMAARLARQAAVPTVTIHGDLCDMRLYSEEQTTTQIEAFVEQLEG